MRGLFSKPDCTEGERNIPPSAIPPTPLRPIHPRGTLLEVTSQAQSLMIAFPVISGWIKENI